MTLYIAKKSRYCFRFVCLLICLHSFFFFWFDLQKEKKNQAAAHRITGKKPCWVTSGEPLSHDAKSSWFDKPRLQQGLMPWAWRISESLFFWRGSTWSPISQELSNCAHLTRVWHRAVLHSQVAISTVGSWRHWVLSESLMFKDPSLSCAGIYSSLCFGCTSPWFIFFSTQSTWDYEWWNAVNLPCYSGWIFSSAKYKQPILKWSSSTMNGSL